MNRSTPVRSVAAIATRRIDCQQFFEVKLCDLAQLFRRAGVLEAFGHIVEPGAVFILESKQRRDGDCPTTRAWQGTRRPRCGRGVLAQFGAPPGLPLGSGHWSGAEAGSGHGSARLAIVTVTFPNGRGLTIREELASGAANRATNLYSVDPVGSGP